MGSFGSKLSGSIFVKVNPIFTLMNGYHDEPVQYHYRWMIALLLVGILGSMIFAGLTRKKRSHYQIFQQYYSPIDIDQRDHTYMRDAYTISQEQGIDIAIQRLDSLLILRPHTDLYYAKVHLLLEDQQLARAASIMERHYDDLVETHSDIDWYLGLSYFGLGAPAQGLQHMHAVAGDRRQSALSIIDRYQ